MKLYFKHVACVIFALIFISLPFYAVSADRVDIYNAADSIATEIIKNKSNEYGNIYNGSFCEFAGTAQGDWFIFAAAKSEGTSPDCEYVKAIKESLPDKDMNTPTDLHRGALTLFALGVDSRDFYGRDLINESVFYCENLEAQGVNGLIWALITIDALECETPENSLVDREWLINKIVDYSAENGSYSLNGKNPDTDISAMAVTALAPYYNQDERVKTAVDKTLDWISENQTPDGDFKAWGNANAETTAQVIIALCSLGIGIEADRRFIKNGNSLFDGLMKYYIHETGFAHIIGEGGEMAENAIATAQGLCALRAISLFKEGKRLYAIKNEVSPIISTQDQEIQTEEGEKGFPLWKTVVIIVGVVTASAIIAVMAVKKKAFLAVPLIVVIIAVIFIGFSNFQTVEEYYNENPKPVNSETSTVVITIRCDNALGQKRFEKLAEQGYIPENGIILEPTEFVLLEGDSAFDILERVVKSEKIQMEYEGTKVAAYIEGISYLYEFDCGKTSGWMYKVNGESPDKGISQYYPKENDVIEIYYTIDYDFE